MSEKKAKILIIDDQPSEVKMVKMALICSQKCV